MRRLRSSVKSIDQRQVWAKSASPTDTSEGLESPQLGHSRDFDERPVLVKAAVEVATCLWVQSLLYL